MTYNVVIPPHTFGNGSDRDPSGPRNPKLIAKRRAANKAARKARAKNRR